VAVVLLGALEVGLFAALLTVGGRRDNMGLALGALGLAAIGSACLLLLLRAVAASLNDRELASRFLRYLAVLVLLPFVGGAAGYGLRAAVRGVAVDPWAVTLLLLVLGAIVLLVLLVWYLSLLSDLRELLSDR
jgi:hypothetical protein